MSYNPCVNETQRGMMMESMADLIFANARQAQETFAAGVKAADETSPSARKLARLIAAAEDVAATLAGNAGARWLIDRAAFDLRAAIEEARKP